MQKGKCPYANRQASSTSIRCSVLREKNAKWDFCLHQYFCRVSGKYELKPEASICEMSNEKELNEKNGSY